MDGKQPNLDSPILAEIVRRLVEVYHLERIYLFGSVARGDAGPDSDYDFMVIVPDDTPAELRDCARAYQAFWGITPGGIGTASDVLVWTRSYFERTADLESSLPSTVLREGRLLYAA